MEERLLIDKLLEGQEHAFRFAVQEFQPIMLQVARSIIGHSLAEEVVQEAWVSVIKGLPKFEGRAALKTWILRIVANTAKTRIRKESRNIAVGDAEDVQSSANMDSRFDEKGHWTQPPRHWHSEQPDQLLASEELQQTLQSAIANLPANQQTVLMLREMEGMDMDEICKILDVSHSNARVLLHRARTTLWQRIEESGV